MDRYHHHSSHSTDCGAGVRSHTVSAFISSNFDRASTFVYQIQLAYSPLFIYILLSLSMFSVHETTNKRIQKRRLHMRENTTQVNLQFPFTDNAWLLARARTQPMWFSILPILLRNNEMKIRHHFYRYRLALATWLRFLPAQLCRGTQSTRGAGNIAGGME